jgi:hypothetical protein
MQRSGLARAGRSKCINFGICYGYNHIHSMHHGLLATLGAAAGSGATALQQHLIPKIGSLIGAFTSGGDSPLTTMGGSAISSILESLANRSAQLRHYPMMEADTVAFNPAYYGHVKPFFSDGRESSIQDLIARQQAHASVNPLDNVVGGATGRSFTKVWDQYNRNQRYGAPQPFNAPGSMVSNQLVPVATPASDMQRLHPIMQQAAPRGALYGPSVGAEYLDSPTRPPTVRSRQVAVDVNPNLRDPVLPNKRAVERNPFGRPKRYIR